MTTPELQEVASGMTEDQAASALLEKWAAKDEPEAESTEAETTEEAEPEQSEQDDAQGEGESEEQAEESGDIEIDVGGEKFKVPAAQSETAKRIEAKVKEIEAGTTRKFQEAAELRKTAEAQIEAAKQMQEIAHEQSDLIADHKMVERRLAALAQIDINALAEQDPVQLAKLTAEYTQLSSAKSRIEAAYQQSVQKGREKQADLSKQKVAQLDEFARKHIKGWNADYSNNLLKFAVQDLGFSPDVLRSSLSEPLIKALDFAYQGHKVRTASPKDKLVTSGKTLKPGAAIVKTTAHAAVEKAQKRLANSGRVEDAAMALLARSNIRKR